MNTTYRKNLKAVATACKNYTDKKIDDLKWELGSHTLDVESDTTTAYTKTVPSDVIGCQINKLGGMSYKSENLLALSDVAETTTNGITYKVDNGVLTLNGTATSSFNFGVEINDVAINTYSSLIKINGTTTNTNNWLLSNTSNSGSDFNFGNVDGMQKSGLTTTQVNSFIRSYISNGSTYTNYQVKFMLVAGSTAPTEYQPYFTGIRDSAVSSVVSKDSNDTTLDTFTIPAEVQALEGYGWGVNDTCYNYIDYEAKKFIKKVGRVDLSTLNWVYYENQGSNALFEAATGDMKSDASNFLCSLYSYGIPTSLNTDNLIIGAIGKQLRIRNTAYTSASAFKTAMSGVYLYYELATPIETDISEYIDDGSIEVEGGGTLIFDNTYNQAVPSEVDYLIEEVKA